MRRGAPEERSPQRHGDQHGAGTAERQRIHGIDAEQQRMDRARRSPGQWEAENEPAGNQQQRIAQHHADHIGASAPSAMRIPISPARFAIPYDITP